jgi:hypothetical protein
MSQTRTRLWPGDVPEETKKDEAAAGVAAFVIGGLALAAGVLLGGWAVTMLWFWFLTPFGLPEISLAHGFGLALTARFLVQSQGRKSEKAGLEKAVESLVFALVVPPAVVGIGWLAKLFT